MVNFSLLSLNNNIYQKFNHNKNYNHSKLVNDTVSLSFKGNLENIEDNEINIPIYDFLIKMKAKSEAKEILKNSTHIKKSAILEYRRANALVNAEEKWIATGQLSKDNEIEMSSGKTIYKTYQQGRLKRETHYTQDGKYVLINKIDIYNPDGTKDVILTNNGNGIKLIQKGVKQIGPKSYLEDKIYTYLNGGLLQFYYDNASKVNDGVAKSKSETKHNVHKFEDNKLLYFVPRATYVGNELHYDKKYIFEDGKIKTYMVDVDVIKGEDEPNKRYDF